MATSDPAGLAYSVSAPDPRTHLFAVTLRIERPAEQQLLSLPVWIPGSYLVREFAKQLQNLRASQNGRPVDLVQRDKCSWRAACQPGQALELRYEVHAFDPSVRTAWLDARRGFFNGTSLCLRVHGQEDQPHRLTLDRDDWPRDWRLATALPPQQVDDRGFGSYLASSYDELVDSPVELGNFWSGSFMAGGIVHRFVVAGAPAGFDGARLLADTQAICEAAIRFWHDEPAQPAPHGHYLFLLNAVHEGYGGLEHRHSTALICKRADLPRRDQGSDTPRPDGYVTLLGLISHEYFHTWNVKRLRPAEFSRYDYSQENYTDLLWFFEGFTSYYDDLLLRRAGLIDNERYLKLLAKTINQVMQTPGRAVQSVAQASRDAWIKYYRPDENTVNATVSYYTKGALLALCLDLRLRSLGNTSLDQVMRALWQRCHGGPMTEADLLAVLDDLSGLDFADELRHWVHSTQELPLKTWLEQHGLRYEEDKAPLADQLGLRVSEQHGLQIKSVLRGSAAERAGMAAGDEWLGIEVAQDQATQAWRLNRLDDLPLYLGDTKTCQALIARDQRLCQLPLELPDTARLVKLGIADAAKLNRWLDGHPDFTQACEGL